MNCQPKRNTILRLHHLPQRRWRNLIRVVLYATILTAVTVPSDATCAGEVVILSDGDFDSLPVGTAPDNREPAGAWGFPRSYISEGEAEKGRSQFEVVETADFDPSRQGNSLHLRSSTGGAASFLPNLFNFILRESPGLVIRANFDIFVPDEQRSGGNFLLGGDHGGRGTDFSDRGPQIGWESGRIVYCQRSCDSPSEATTLVREYPYGQWQKVQLDMDLSADNFDFYWSAGDAPLELIGSDLEFRSQNQRFMDRFTFVHWPAVGSVESYLDNVSITVPGRSLDHPVLQGSGDTYFETFDEALGVDSQSTGQFLPPGWSASDNGLAHEIQTSRKFPVGTSSGRGTPIFNAGGVDDSDRALALGVTRSTDQGTLQFLADISESSASSFQLQFDLEAWDAARVSSLGEAAFDVTVELDDGDGFAQLADLGRVTTGPNLFPPAQDRLDGNSDANRVSFDSGVVNADIPEGSQLRVRWAAATDAATENWVFGLDNVSLSLFGGETVSELLAGDADQDLDFDQLDLVQVQIAAKYLTGQAATWGEGDWNGAPGGTAGNPPAGDGLFNQFDIIAAQQGATYLTGPYAALQANGQPADGQTSVIYNAGTGEVAVDAPAGVELTSINIDSASGIFTGEAAVNLGGSFDNDADGNIFKATFGSSFASISFGNVARTGLSEEFVLGDLTAVGSLSGGGDLGNVDLVYVPEPTTIGLLLFGLLLGLVRLRHTHV